MSVDEPSTAVTIILSNPTDAFNVFGEVGNSNEGISSFKLSAGNRQVTLTDLVLDMNFPYLSYGSVATHVRVFISEESMLKATPAESTFYPVDLEIALDGASLKSATIDRLENGRTYFFRIALVDVAGGVVQFYPGMDNLPASCTTAPDSTCEFSATPSK